LYLSPIVHSVFRPLSRSLASLLSFFFLNDPATTQIYTLSLHDALPISYVIPTLFARVGHALYFHGSAASRMLRNLGEGLPVCVTVTLTDGFVLARSVFNHSMNYRSVVALGKATPVDAPQEKRAALHGFTE